MRGLTDETLLSIIGDIYDCALDPEGWTAVLSRITTAIDAAYTTISLTSLVENRGRFAARSPWDADRMVALQNYDLHEIPGLMEAVAGDIDVPVTALSVIAEPELQKLKFFREWAGPQGLRDACTVKFAHTSGRIGLLSTTTWMGRDTISREGRSFLTRLSPHLRRASLIGDLLDNARVASMLYRGVLDGLAVPIVITGEDATIHYANAQAELMLVARTPLVSVHGKVFAQNPAAAPALREAIARAGHADASLGLRGIGLPISAPGHPPAVAYVLPLSEGTVRSVFRPACAAIFVSTTASAYPVPEAALTTLYDLTPAEARVLLRVGTGQSVSACARSLSISESTIKTHLGRIYLKTGVNRQPELVRLVSELNMPFIGRSN